jgi:UDP-glucose 4-epimerase
MDLKNEKIFITGGAGFLGKNLIKDLYEDNEITVYSRDESKHYFLKKKYPRVNFAIGDIRNYDLMKRKSTNHTIGIFAASLKQIDACDTNFEEASKVIIDGSFNSRRVAEENGFKSACFISTDKSRAATTIYGSMKYVAGESFISHSNGDINLSTAVYGNVMNSTGSIIPLIFEFIKENRKLTLYGKNMTRFLLTVESAISLIKESLDYNGVNVIPNAKSFSVLDLCEIYVDQFGLKFDIGEPRIGEKIHEIMASSEEIRRMEYIKERDIFLMCPGKEFNELNFKNDQYSSKDFMLSKEELFKFLKEKDFYRP